MVTLTENKKHIIIKRDGREEPYNEEKLKTVIMWATNNSKILTEKILKNLNIKINDRMRINILYDELISTVVNMISPLYPDFQFIAGKLYLMKIYKETWGLKRVENYPHLKEFLEEGLKSKLYDSDFINDFTEEELEEINSYIKVERDLLYTYKGLVIMYDKYCKKYRGKKAELPQITYMIAAMFSFYKDHSKDRLKLIKETYDMLSTKKVTFATPRLMNSGIVNCQLASCVLNTVADDTWSLNQTDGNAALYSKFAGGIAYDASFVRASGSKIGVGNKGVSDGPVPFIKRTEQTISSFNQQGKRKGSAVISFCWWHLDVQDLLMLKDAGGAEDNRARKLQYAIKINEEFIKRVKKDENVTLFCPSQTPLLLESFGEEFSNNYKMYEEKGGIRKKTIKARDLAYLILKVRKETGNLYITFVDNINEQNVRNVFVGSSNLCQEIVIPSSPSKKLETRIIEDFDTGKIKIIEEKESGEIGICNLASINLVEWIKLTDNQKRKLTYTLLRGMDNTLDTQFYPVAEGKVSNLRNRPIGIGVLNYANLLAQNKIKFTDDEALEFTNLLFDDLYYHIYESSVELAKERGAYKTFKNDKWAKGLTPFHLSKLDTKKLKISSNKEKWDKLGKDIKEHGIRFSFHAAIAPTATSGKASDLTESIEPINSLFYIEEGTLVLPTLAPNLKENREYYQRCWEIPAKTLIELAAIRQRYMDQSQSINLYYVKPESAKELWLDIEYASKLGLKTLYYLKTPKDESVLEHICESCS